MPNCGGVGAKTVPLMLVVPPLGQVVCCGQRLMHGLETPQMLGPAPPQTWPLGQVLPQSIEPPQPSPIVPQYWTPAWGVQLPGTQAGSPHR